MTTEAPWHPIYIVNYQHYSTRPWVGVDLDGTLAVYGATDYHHTTIGEPIPLMVERVKKWLAEGNYQVRIMTARVSDGNSDTVEAIENWCLTHIGQILPITNVKDYNMVALYDDRAVQVVSNTGALVGVAEEVES